MSYVSEMKIFNARSLYYRFELRIGGGLFQELLNLERFFLKIRDLLSKITYLLMLDIGLSWDSGATG
jgi:hypothetical protein